MFGEALIPHSGSDPVPVLQHSVSSSDVNEVLRAAKPNHCKGCLDQS